MDLETARNFLIALLIGALVGIEREKKRASETGPTFGGIRTYILLALVGAASAWLSHEFTLPWAFVVTLAVVGANVVASYALQNREGDEAPGVTSEVAAIAVCLLGAMVVVGQPELAVALAVVTSAVLAYKQPLHGLVARIDADDLFAGIKLLIASFIVLPLLPDGTVDPWDAINPYKLWLLVVLISALSLVGYVAIRWLGAAHGHALTGVAGGLVSSTATTLSFARGTRDAGTPAESRAITAGILLSWLVMSLRVLVLVAIVNLPLLRSTWLPFVAMGMATAAFAFAHYRASLSASDGRREATVHVSNPFSLGAAIRFGALFAVMLLIVKLAQQHLSGGAIYLVAAIAGTVDVDAIALSMASGARGEDDFSRAGAAIAIAAIANTVVKCGMVLALGRGPARRHVALATAVVLVVGLVVVGVA
jgi:uncharacterized membrane protein (DUF4010 family)